jgi:iron complex transport system permease protein
LLSGSRLNSALIILFVGAITAIFTVGRTIKPAGSSPDEAPDQE